MRTRSALVKAYEDAGFTLVRAAKHRVWRCPCGHTCVVTPGTPGEGRALKNCFAQLTRTLRACTS